MVDPVITAHVSLQSWRNCNLIFPVQITSCFRPDKKHGEFVIQFLNRLRYKGTTINDLGGVLTLSSVTPSAQYKYRTSPFKKKSMAYL